MARVVGVFTVRADGLDGRKAVEYEAAIVGMLHGLERVGTSRALFDESRAVGRPILIVPYDDEDDPCNATAGSQTGLFPTRVEYTPLGHFAVSACFPPPSPGASAHEVFVHELTHAVRSAARTLNQGVTDDGEEDLAILVANIFASETHRRLRRDHSGHAEQTDPVLSTSAGALAANPLLIERFCTQDPNLTAALAAVNAPFNPLKEYYAQHAPARSR